jgi:hypothetical protein
VTESRESLDDPDVNDDDYREIYGEMDAWVAGYGIPAHTCRTSSPP